MNESIISCGYSLYTCNLKDEYKRKKKGDDFTNNEIETLRYLLDKYALFYSSSYMGSEFRPGFNGSGIRLIPLPYMAFLHKLLVIDINKFEDEWYIVTSDRSIHLCDQLDGVINCLKNEYS